MPGDPLAYESFLNWSRYTLEPHTVYLWQSGPIRVFVKRDRGNWWMAHRLDSMLSALPSFGVSGAPSEALEWLRWAYGEERPDVVFAPELSERPLLVKTRDSCLIPPQCRAQFYLSMPLWLSISPLSAEGDPKASSEAIRVTTQLLSNTWFGDYEDGHLCYALPTKAEPDPSHLDRSPTHAACSFTIFNQSNRPLPLARIVISPENLGLFEVNGTLWTNEVFVSFKGAGEPNRLRFSKTPPKSLGSARVVRFPRLESESSLLHRSFRLGF